MTLDVGQQGRQCALLQDFVLEVCDLSTINDPIRVVQS